jgi:hypothetical protein
VRNHPGIRRLKTVMVEFLPRCHSMKSKQFIDSIIALMQPCRFLKNDGYGWCFAEESDVRNKIIKLKCSLLKGKKKIGPSMELVNVPESLPVEIDNQGGEFYEEANVDESQQTYVEDVAWSLKHWDFKLDPPAPLPKIMSDENMHCSFNAKERILKVTIQPDHILSQQNKKFLYTMMERDDIAVITHGLCHALDSSMWSSKEGFCKTSGGLDHNVFRRFKKKSGDFSGEYEEVNKDISMSADKYFEYLEERQKMLDGLRQSNTMLYTDGEGELNDFDLNDVLYMLDYDMKSKLPDHHNDFLSSFLFPEILPGGELCAMATVPASAHPNMGPNLYITPPGSFTRFHQDGKKIPPLNLFRNMYTNHLCWKGSGTVDSGHLCLTGYNEVVMLRRLPSTDHEKIAMGDDIEYLLDLPHTDVPVSTTIWFVLASNHDCNLPNLRRETK